jgi:hypothetical protein
MSKQILSEEFRKMQKLAGIITETQYNQLNENQTAEELFQMFKDKDLLNDRREYDVEDLMSAYPDLSQEEAEKLEQMLQNINEKSLDEIPITPEVKVFIDKAINDAKRDNEFEYLKDVDFFDNDLIDLIIDKFSNDGDYNDVSQEVKDYITNSIK